jgi:hypothetical protein
LFLCQDSCPTNFSLSISVINRALATN